MPESSPKWLAASIQGLGLGALVLVVLSGITWLILWWQDSALANKAKDIHKSLIGLIETYIMSDEIMGLIHFILWRKAK